MPQHAERRFLPYSSAQMFDLVAEVERYPEFLPWCLGTRVTRREPGEPGIVEADMLIGFMMFRERFGSRVQLHRDEYRIEVNYTHGPFRYLVNRWRFDERTDGCEVDFFVDFEFRSRAAQARHGRALRRCSGPHGPRLRGPRPAALRHAGGGSDGLGAEAGRGGKTRNYKTNPISHNHIV